MALSSTSIKSTSHLVTEKPTRHLNQIELSRRWSISPRTLERWRWRRQGPQYLKIGGRVVYRLEDVETFEVAQTKASTHVRKGVQA